jgi:TRAP-type C4-dicarboxylate transport system permease large subunit
MPNDLKDGITHLGLPPLALIAAMMAVYVVLGTIMEELTMVLLTLPVFFPVVTALGFDPVWFGVLIVLVVQVGLISPPVGMKMFVMNALLKDVPLAQIFRGSAIFCVPLAIGLVLVLLFPQLALWLPGFMK